MTLKERVLKELKMARGPVSARSLQARVTQDTDPSARHVRRAIRDLKIEGHPIASTRYGHEYDAEWVRFRINQAELEELVAKAVRALRISVRAQGRRNG